MTGSPDGEGDAPTDDDAHVCDACGDTFESEAALERHVHDVGLVD